MGQTEFMIVRWGMILLLFAVLFAVFRHVMFAVVPYGRSRWREVRRMFRSKRYSPEILRALGIQNGEKLEAMKRNLAGAGLNLDAVQYILLKRLLCALSVLTGLVSVASYADSWIGPAASMITVALAAAVLTAILADKRILAELKRRRGVRIVQEVYTVSRHLLYHADTGVNLHAQLIRCIPYTVKIRPALYRLAGEWYEDPAEALDRCKQTLGTEDGRSFVETLDSIRRHQHESYYDLMRDRIGDYKEKIELKKDSRRELNSYLLFILAGIPILYTFQIFIYPWVQEGERLFRSLN